MKLNVQNKKLFIVLLMHTSLITCCHSQVHINSKISIDSNITINLRDNNIISGSLIKSEKDCPLIILVSPPLAENRNLNTAKSTIGMFEYLALRLAKEGFGIFWYDNRGKSKSTGNTDSTTIYTQSEDLQDIISYFQNKSPKQEIGLIGISEGGATVEIVTSKNNKISFIILLSVQGISGYEFFKYQTKNMFAERGNLYNQKSLTDSIYKRYDKISYNLYKVLDLYENTDSIKYHLTKEIDLQIRNNSTTKSEKKIEQEKKSFATWLTPQQIALRKFKPEKYLSKIACPILIICGDMDEYIDCEPNLKYLDSILIHQQHKDFAIVKIPFINHAYRTIEKNTFNELKYKNEIFSEIAIQNIIKWLIKIKTTNKNYK